MFQRRRRRKTTEEPRVAPPFMHDVDREEELAELERELESKRLALLAERPPDDPYVRGLDAQLGAYRTALIAVRVASVAIDRSLTSGSLQG